MTTKTILITGASSGIGWETAQLYQQKGWQVYGLSRSGAVPQGVTPLRADVAKPDELANALQPLTVLHAVVHAAGIGGAGPWEVFAPQEAHNIMQTNFFGAFHVMQATLPLLRAAGGGHLLMVSSIAGHTAVPYHGVYSASKFALEGLVESLRLELRGSGIHAVSICPGDTATPIIANQYRLKIEYVPTAYRESYAKTEKAMRDSVDAGIPPSQVARTIARVVAKRKPAICYTVGTPLQRLAPTLKRCLPARLFEFIMASYYGI